MKESELRGSKRDKLTYEEFLKQDQVSEELFHIREAIQMADLSISNNGSLEDLHQEIDKLYPMIAAILINSLFKTQEILTYSINPPIMGELWRLGDTQIPSGRSVLHRLSALSRQLFSLGSHFKIGCHEANFGFSNSIDIRSDHL